MLLLVVAVVWWALNAVANEPRVRVVVESGYFVRAPAWIRLRVSVEPDAANLVLIVGALSDGFERVSDEQLDGARSRRTRWIEWPAVPAGLCGKAL